VTYYTFMAALGLFGSGLVIWAYFANQQGWMSANGWRYSALNLVGALLILASLYAEWNMPSAFIEAFWAAISLYGLLRAVTRRRLERSTSRA
jgi:Na+-translocating ferredoxin:NAD+ oxidoreductase RnfD subunit